MLSLARPLIKPALGALASAGLSFGAEKGLKKIFGRGFGPKEIELYKLVQQMAPAQKKEVERYHVRKRCKRRRRTIRWFPWFVSVYGDTFGYRLSQKDTWKRFANSTTTSTTLPPTPTSKGKRNANATPTFLWNVG